MDECNTPTEKRVGPQLDRVIDCLKPALEAGQTPNLPEIREIFLACGLTVGESRDDYEPNINEAFEILAAISTEDEEVAEGIRVAMMSIGTALFGSLIDYSSRAVNREMASLRGLNARNKSLKRAADRAREVAVEKWAEDHDQCIRIGEMAQAIYAQLHSEGLDKVLPKDPDGVRKWIRPVAPPHAIRPGRTKKPG
ncbi:hypothetical protein [Pseudomonas sp. B21-047]|uniref:hypothetical protein n=1 Tax=Pseudomonas sp. B21-047 TaxID=2895489 RepID=UPI0021602D4E|nr:hypothetical protein [Pseudomonas sp. B21-047]UVL04772.1 hypothetical protein LOY26_04285 [Pseudomonas sp. B21-047]